MFSKYRKSVWILLIIFSFIFISSCNNFGKKKDFKNLELYYTKNITKQEVNKLGNFLIETKFVKDKKISVQITKKNNKYQFRMVVKKEARDFEELQKHAGYLAKAISIKIFDNTPVEFHACDNNLKTLKIFQMSQTSSSYGYEKNFKGIHLFYTTKVTESEADTLGKFLVKNKFSKSSKITAVQLNKKGEVYQFRMVVNKKSLNDPRLKIYGENLAKELSLKVFNNASVEFHACTGKLETLKVYQMASNSATKYGKFKKIKGLTLFYTSYVTEKEVDALGEFLLKTKFIGNNKLSVQLNKKEDTYQFRMVVKEGIEKTPKFKKQTLKYSKIMSNKVFNSAPLEVHACTPKFKTLKVFK